MTFLSKEAHALEGARYFDVDLADPRAQSLSLPPTTLVPASPVEAPESTRNRGESL
jgi:hypothetical protein